MKGEEWEVESALSRASACEREKPSIVSCEGDHTSSNIQPLMYILYTDAYIEVLLREGHNVFLAEQLYGFLKVTSAVTVVSSTE